jgi:hypothetical protein
MAPRRPIHADDDPIRREFERIAPADAYQRNAAYRRLALAILGLDVRSLVQTLPLTDTRTAEWEGDS